MLSEEEVNFLDTNGYLNLGQLLSLEQVKTINSRLAEIQAEEGENAGAELAESKYIRHPKEEGADRLADLVNKGEVFDIFYTHSRVLAAIEVVLGKEYKLSSLNYRAAKPNQADQQPDAGNHPDEIRIIAPAGSVFIFNSHVWHGGTTNYTNQDRRSIHSYFCTRDQPQQIDQKKYIRQETLNRIGEKGRIVLDV